LEGPEPDFGKIAVEKQGSLYRTASWAAGCWYPSHEHSDPIRPSRHSLPHLFSLTRRPCPQSSTSLHDVEAEVQSSTVIGGGVTKLVLSCRAHWPIPTLLHPGPASLLHLKRPLAQAPQPRQQSHCLSYCLFLARSDGP